MTNERDFRYLNLWFQYADGFAYSKHKMEEAFRPGGFLEKVAPKPPAAAKDPLKREDVDLIVRFKDIVLQLYMSSWYHLLGTRIRNFACTSRESSFRERVRRSEGPQRLSSSTFK